MTAGQDMLRTEPHRPGLSEREVGGNESKKVPEGMLPVSWLCDALK